MPMIPFPLLARFFVVTGFLLSASAALAQVSQISTPERWVRPQLVLPSRAESPVVLQSVRQRVEVSGRLALTEIEMTFYNPNHRILEGELQFPLLDRQSVSGFAMDVNGSLREAVPVEKTLGQAVFEDITRGRIDPGLLEVTQGNNFKLRVYPIPAAGTKRVVVRISEPLAERNGRQVYRVPLEYAERLAAFSLDVRVAGAGAAPTVAQGAFGNVSFVRDGDVFHARVERSDFAGRGVLEIEVPVQRGANAITQSQDGKVYFYADVPLALRSMRRAVPRLVSLVWDASGSGAARDHGREFALLDAYFKTMRDGEVRLTRIRDVAEPALKFRITDGDWRTLRKELEATAYDGATNLGAFVPDAAVREIVLFSDGLSNFGEQPFPVTRVPAYTVSAAVKADTLRLRHIADRSGARFVDLVADTPAEAAHKLLFATSRVTHIDSRGASQLVLASPFVENGRVALAGQMTEPVATLRIVVEHPGGASASFEVVARAGQSSSVLAAAQWARLHIAELEGEYDLNRAEIRRLGKAFGLVTRNTSLIVLDQVADYARFDIAPPPELRAEYERLVQNATQRRDADRKTHLEQVVRLFEEKVAWWKRDFPKDEIAKIAAEAKINGAVAQDAFMRQRADRAEERGSPAAPATSAPLAAPAAKAMQAFNSAGRLAKAAAEPSQTTATIQLQKWQPDAPYAERMRNAAAADLYRVYLDEKPGYANSTAFFLDAADVFFERGMNELGIRVLSNLAEMDLENRHILRILGYRLVQASEPGLAIPVFRTVLALSPEEPQSYRDLGLAYAAGRQPQKAIDTLYEVVIRPWHGRFPEIELITLAELNAVVATTNGGTRLDTGRIDARLLKNLPLDLRAVLTWDADNTDIDLWVTDPNGEKAFYGHRMTYQGGRMSLDFTGGYGPEEFSLKRAKPGKYKVEAQYFGDRRQNVTGPTTLQVRLTTKFGLPEQKEQIVTLRLKGRQEVVFVGEFEVTEDAGKR